MWICFLLGSLTLPRNKIWYFLMHKVIWQSFNSNSAKLGFTTWFKTEVTHFQMEQKNNCLCLQINFYLANMHGRGENLKANMDSRSEWQLFLPEKSVPTEFALKLWYEINMSFKKKHYCQYFQFIQSQNINSVEACLSGSVGCTPDWWSGGCGSDPHRVGNILSWRLIMKYFLWSFSPFCWFKKGNCQFLAKSCAQYWLTA